MNKKFSIFGIIALSLITVGELSFVMANSISAKSEVQKAESEAVTFTSISWNNIDYNTPIYMPAPETSNFPQYGYVALLKYTTLFNPTMSDNIAYTNHEWTSYIRINGTPIHQIDNAVVRIHAGELYIYFPSSAAVYTDNYYRPTIEVLNGAPFYNLTLPYTRLEYKDQIGTYGSWVDTTNEVKGSVTYTGIHWNNTHQDDQLYPALEGKNALVISYSDNLSTGSKENSKTYVQERNLNNTVAGDNIMLNGTPFSQINGAEIRYFNQNYLYLYAPDMTVPSGDLCAIIEILPVGILDKNIDSHTFYFIGTEWRDNLSVATFNAISFNNVDHWSKAPNLSDLKVPQQGYVLGLEYLDNIGPGSTIDAVDDVNMATNAYSIGSHLLINGVPCKDISGAMVGSYLTPTYLYIYFPDSSITYTDSYDRPTVEIIPGCVFYSHILPAMRFEFCAPVGHASKWQIKKIASETTYAGIAWNNTDYGLMGSKNGLLLNFANNLSNHSEENGSTATITDRNLINTDLGKNIKLNGVSLNQIPGAEIKYFHSIHLWIYAPTMTTTFNGYLVPHLELIAPTEFLDVIIPSVSFNFTTLWAEDETQHLNTSSFASFYQDYNNKLMDNGLYRDTILTFNKALGGEDKNDTDLIAADEEFVNKATLNGVLLKNVPGIFVIYMGGPYIHLMIRIVDEVPTAQYPCVELTIPQNTHIYDCYLNEITFYINSETYEWMVADHETIIKTQDATFRTTGLTNQITGMCFENRLQKGLFDSMVTKYGMGNISFGTYVVPKSNYLISNASSPIEYINSNAPSSSTYTVIPNTKKDFTNSETAATDGYYRYTGSIYNIKESHYSEGYIGIGYLQVGDRVYYGNISDNATTFYDLLVQAYNASLIDSSHFNSVISFTTTTNAYELNDNSIVGTGYSVNYSAKGYYQLSANKNIKTIVIDGVPYKTNILNGQSIYFAFYNGIIDYRNSLYMSKGIGEPIYDLFPDTLNSNAPLDTVNNVALLNQAFGSDGERIWLDLKTGLGLDSAFYNQTDANGTFHFDDTKVTRLHNYLANFTSKGITELTLLVQGWANAYDAPVFLINGNWYNVDQATALGGAAPSTIVPNQSAESYQKWLDANEDLAYRIAKEFPEFKYIEIANEIDGGGFKYSPDYITSSTTPSIATVAGWAMDLCHSLSKGIRKAHSTLRVMSPAFSCFDANATHPYNTKSFITNCYTHIENSADTDTNSWFQIMNLHPYVFPTKNTVGTDSVYLWENRPYKDYSNRSKIDNTDYDTDWINYMNYVHNTIMGSHKDAKKSVAITEFGFSDLANTDDSYWKYANYNNRFVSMSETMMNRINSLDYIECLIWFRLFDFPVVGSDYGFAYTYEPNFGLINEDKTLKEIGKKIYQLWNGGSTNYSAITSYLSVIEERDLS